MNKLIQLCVKLKNALHANSNYLWVKENKLVLKFAKILFKEGFILGVTKEKNTLKIILKYDLLLTPAIQNIKVISTATNHRYVNHVTLSKMLKLDTLVLLTSEGILTGSEASKRNIGGKLLCSIF